MTTCDDGLWILAAHFVLAVLPIGTALVGLAWVGWRRRSRPANLGGAIVAAILLALGIALASRVGGEAAYFPILMLPALTSAALAWWRPSDATRVAAFVGALVPPLAIQVWSVGQVFATDCAVP